jgi:hypothetical protein
MAARPSPFSAALSSGGELDVGVVEDGMDLEPAPERFDVTLGRREPDVDVLLDAFDVARAVASWR